MSYCAIRSMMDLLVTGMIHRTEYDVKTKEPSPCLEKAMISDIIDIFGMNVLFSDETAEHVTVTACVNEMAMKQFVKSYAPDVMVLEPERLREEIKKEAEKTWAAYSEMSKEE